MVTACKIFDENIVERQTLAYITSLRVALYINTREDGELLKQKFYAKNVPMKGTSERKYEIHRHFLSFTYN